MHTDRVTQGEKDMHTERGAERDAERNPQRQEAERQKEMERQRHVHRETEIQDIDRHTQRQGETHGDRGRAHIYSMLVQYMGMTALFYSGLLSSPCLSDKLIQSMNMQKTSHVWGSRCQ